MKTCKVCFENLSDDCFYANRAKCKSCYRHLSERSDPNKLVSTLYANQKSTSKQRGHPSPSYSRQFLLNWILKQPNFQSLWNNWVSSDYQSDLKPSVDRIDDSIPYTADNICLTTWKKNRSKTRLISKYKAIKAYHVDGTLFMIFPSVASASKQVSRCVSDISKAANGTRKTCGNLIWKWA